MKLAFISDIHSNLPALERVLEEMGPVDEIFCCGDLVGYNAYPAECIEIMRGRGIKCVMGNHDLAVVTGNTENFNQYARKVIDWTSKRIGGEFLSTLKARMEFEIDGKKFLVAHGSPRSIDEYVFPTLPGSYLETLVDKNYDYVVLGHTHLPMIERTERGTFLNPGSVGQPRDGDPRASFALIEGDDIGLCRTDYDVDRTANADLRAGLPRYLSERLYRGF